MKFLCLLILITLSGCAGLQPAQTSMDCQDYEDPNQSEECYLLNIRYAISRKLNNEPYTGFNRLTIDSRIYYPGYRRFDLLIKANLNEFGQVKDVQVLQHSGDTYAQDLIAEAIIEEAPFIPLESYPNIRSITYYCSYQLPLCEIEAQYEVLSSLE